MWSKFSQVFAVLCAVGEILAQTTQWPLHDNGLNQVVQWDHYSLKIRGERLFVWSGEFHYWRIPVPNVWRDLLQKVKAGGFNTVAVYASWAFHNPSPGNVVFEGGAHDIEPIFQYAKEIGLWIIFRPGPYINAETNAGGFPGWVTTGDYGELRNNDTRYTEAWKPYVEKISQIVSKHTVVKGGNVILYQLENEIDNEFLDRNKKVPNWPAIDYMETLEKVVRENGIDIPTFTNAPNMNGRSWSKDYSNFGGEQDIYGLDSYPQCWSCDKSECEQYGVYSRFAVVDYQDHFKFMSPTQPSFLPEFQGGSYNPWGGPQGGCRSESDADFVNVFYRDDISQRATMISLYMLYGGTNWGGLACPVVATSYDYSSPIQEDRRIAAKFSETKLVGLQLRASHDLTKTEQLGRGNASYTDNPVIHATELRNEDAKSAFYIIRHNPSNLTTTDQYKLNINTSIGKFTVPQSFSSLELIGHESKILPVDYSLTNDRKVIYATAEILAFSTIDKSSPLLVLWVPANGQGEVLFQGVRGGKVLTGKGKIMEKPRGTTLLAFQASSSTVVQFADGLRVLIVDRPSAYNLWVPSLSNTPTSPPEQNIVVTGPYLVRSVSVDRSSVILTGDADSKTTIEVFGPSNAKGITWNGQRLSTRQTSYGSLVGSIPSPGSVNIGKFSQWKVADGLPERKASYDDSKWTVADLKSTASFTPPETYPVLYAEEYGIYTGPILWRGRFPSTTNATGVYLKVNGGTSFGYSVYLNGGYIGSWRGYRYTGTQNMTLSFQNATLTTKEDNVLLVVQDHSGKDLRGGALEPRGIYNATLLGSVGNFTSWKVAGTAGHKSGGGELIDPIRGPLNEGGLHAERLGWHLPGFNDRSWPTASSLHLNSDGMAFYRSTISTNVPRGLDASLAFEVTDPGTTRDFRVQIYVNGYQYGKFWSRIGNQIEFPVPPGVLDYSGKPNTVGVAVWAQDSGGAVFSIDLEVLKVVESGFDPMDGTENLRPAYTDRLKYY